jgi:hypothetical protein
MKAASAACVFLCLAVSAHTVPTSAHQAQPADGGVCVKGRALIAHAAYVPPPVTADKCAQLLSTSTIMTPRRWNKT